MKPLGDSRRPFTALSVMDTVFPLRSETAQTQLSSMACKTCSSRTETLSYARFDLGSDNVVTGKLPLHHDGGLTLLAAVGRIWKRASRASCLIASCRSWRYAASMEIVMTRMSSVLFALAVMLAGCDTAAKQSVKVPLKDSAPAEHIGTVRKPLNGDVTIDLTASELPDRRIRLHGTTNLPAGTTLMLSVAERMQGGFIGQTKGSVASDGSFSSDALGPTGGLKDGLYIAEVVMPVPSVQPDDARRIIGDNGEHLSGPLVENGAFGVTISTKKEFTVGGAQAVQAQKQRAKDAEEAIAELQFALAVHLEQLLVFKDAEGFRTFGFGRGGPYHEWFMAVQALRDSQSIGLTHPVPFLLRTAPGDLLMLGMEYVKKRRDTDYIRQVLPELQQTIDYAGYLAAKRPRGGEAPERNQRSQ